MPHYNRKVHNRAFPYTRMVPILFALLTATLCCHGQISRYDTPTGLALSGVRIAARDDPWLALSNPAFIVATDSITIALSVVQPTMGLAAMGSANLLVVPAGSENYRFFGATYALVIGPYRDIEFSGGVATDPSVDISVGASVSLRMLAVEAYPTLACGTISLGGRLRVNDAIEVALSLTNIARATVGDLPPSTSIGMDVSARLTPQTAMGISLTHEADRGAGAALGLLTDVGEGFRFLAGLTSDPVGVSIGGSISTATFGYDLGASWTVPLGARVAVGVRFGIGE